VPLLLLSLMSASRGQLGGCSPPQIAMLLKLQQAALPPQAAPPPVNVGLPASGCLPLSMPQPISGLIPEGHRGWHQREGEGGEGLLTAGWPEQLPGLTCAPPPPAKEGGELLASGGRWEGQGMGRERGR